MLLTSPNILLWSCHLSPAVTIKLLVAIPCPLYKKKPLCIISALSFIPGAAAVVFFLGTVFLFFSSIEALYHRTGIKIPFAASPECFYLTTHPLGFAERLLVPSIVSSSSSIPAPRAALAAGAG